MDMASVEQAILGRIDPQTAAVVRLKVLETVDSTNERLRIAVAEGVAEHGQVLIAGQQTAGRGRLGRQWLSPPGTNLYLSLCWRIDGEPATLEGLSLAVGCAVAECLASDLGVSIQLKWPNDLYLGNAKCGGVLIELATDPAGDWWVVIGLGLNVAMPAENAAGIVTPWTDLASHASNPPAHTQVAGLVITALPGRTDGWPGTCCMVSAYGSSRQPSHFMGALRALMPMAPSVWKQTRGPLKYRRVTRRSYGGAWRDGSIGRYRQ